MTDLAVGIVGVLALLGLVTLGVRVAFAAGLVGLIGLSVIRGFDPAGWLAGLLSYAETSHYTLSVIPLFILMGFLSHLAGLTQSLFRAARAWIGWLPGGLPAATIFAAAGFGAASGSSTATSAVFAKTAIPDMLKSGYAQSAAAGAVAVGGTIAALIPPSSILVIYAIIVEESVAALLLAGLLPGILTAIVYGGVAIFVGVRQQKQNKAIQIERASWEERLTATALSWPLPVIVLVVIGGLYSGVMTPTEVGAVCAAIVFILAFLRRDTTMKDVGEAFSQTVRLTASIFLIIFCVLLFVRFLGFTGLPAAIVSFVDGLNWPPLAILIAILAIYFIFGMFMDAIGMMMLTLPVFYPVIIALGFDSIWFGILVVKMIEVSLVTPPIGLNCFVVNGVRPDISLTDVFKGVAPFVAADIVVITLLIAFPQIALFLPGKMS